LQIKVQGISMLQAVGFRQILLGQQAADLHLWHINAILREDIQAQGLFFRALRQAYQQLTPSEKIAPFTQAQHTIDQLALLRLEQFAPELALQGGVQLSWWRL